MYAKKVAVNQQIFLELNYYKVTTSSNIYVPLNSSIPPPPRLTPRNTLEIAQTKWKKEKQPPYFLWLHIRIQCCLVRVKRALSRT